MPIRPKYILHTVGLDRYGALGSASLGIPADADVKGAVRLLAHLASHKFRVYGYDSGFGG